MNLSDQKRIGADRETVFNALLDPEVLKACVPGCEEMTGSPDEGFEATVTQKVGPVKATFRGVVQLSDINAPESMTISGEGKGGAAGFAKGGAKVRLEADGAATILHYEVDAKVGGKLAQLGSRVIDGFAKKTADQFFTNFQDTVGRPEPVANPAADVTTVGAPDAGEKKKGWLRRLVG